MTQKTAEDRPSLFFPLGQIVLDSQSARKLSSEDVIPALGRHICGDWGGVSQIRRNANEEALRKHRALSSIYFSMDGVRFRITTSADRSVTSIKTF
jgi:hypothetical protein